MKSITKRVITSVLGLTAALASTSCYMEGPPYGGPGGYGPRPAYSPGYSSPRPAYGSGYGYGAPRPAAGWGGGERYGDRDSRIDSRHDSRVYSRGVSAGRNDRMNRRSYNPGRYSGSLMPGDRAEFSRGYAAGYR